MKDRALVVAPLSACVGEGRDEVRGEGWNGLHSVHLSCSRNCRDLNHFGEGRKTDVSRNAPTISKPVKDWTTRRKIENWTRTEGETGWTIGQKVGQPNLTSQPPGRGRHLMDRCSDNPSPRISTWPLSSRPAVSTRPYKAHVPGVPAASHTCSIKYLPLPAPAPSPKGERGKMPDNRHHAQQANTNSA